MISENQAKEIATRHGFELGLEPFHIEEVHLNTESHCWRVYLWFDEVDENEVGQPLCVVVEVDSRTGVPETIQTR